MIVSHPPDRASTFTEKIVRAHMVEGPHRPLVAGDVVALRPRHLLTHDNTAAIIDKFRAIGATSVKFPWQPVFALDHEVQSRSDEVLRKHEAIERFAREQRIDFHPVGEGIGHQLMVAEGYAVPGSLCVAADSHANTYGALGCLGTPVVRTDAAAIWCTGDFWWQIPPVVQVVLEGELPEGVSGKDLILALCGLYSSGEVLNAVVEFCGDGVGSLSMDARLSIANMTTEWGALAGLFPVDSITIDHLRRTRNRLASRGLRRFGEGQLVRWQSDPPGPDPDAEYAGRIYFDLSELSPQIAGPDTVHAVSPLSSYAARRRPIQKAYLLSCANGRLEDLESAADILRGRRIREGVEFYVAAASAEVQAAAERAGIWRDIVAAGAHVLPPGCGPCIGLGEGLVRSGEVAVSSTARNFKGRMGSPDAEVYLASPAVVASSAVAGYIRGPLDIQPACDLRPAYEALHPIEPLRVENVCVEGFPRRVQGRGLLLDFDDLDTDRIYSKEHVYRDRTPEQMARLVLRAHDPRFAGMVRAGDVLIAGRNFGTGSSREQAATALQAAGIRLVVAASFSSTFLRNAYNNGLPCIVAPQFVAHVRRCYGDGGVGTVGLDGEVSVDFGEGRIRLADASFRFRPLGRLAQSLVVAGGVVPLVRERLGLGRARRANG